MKKVLIISTSMNEQDMIEQVAENHNPTLMSVETTGSFGQEVLWWAQNAPDLLIINLPTDDLLQGYFFTKLKNDIPKSLPILFLCDTITSALMQMSQHFQVVRIIKTPVSEFNLYRAVIDVFSVPNPGQQQIQPRYLTDQTITVFSDLKAGRIKAKMKNLSMSGAFFETKEKTLPITIGDIVRISILSSIKEYVFDSKVIWSKKLSEETMGFGVAFVNKDEVYEAILKAL